MRPMSRDVLKIYKRSYLRRSHDYFGKEGKPTN